MKHITCLLIIVLLAVSCKKSFQSNIKETSRKANNKDELIYDIEGQAQRRMNLIKSFTAQRVDYYNDEGDWVGDPEEEPLGWAGWMYVTPFLVSGDTVAIRRANATLEKGLGWSVDFAHILVAYRDLLTDDAVAAMEEVLSREVRDKHAAPDREYMGDNDNHPCMSAAAIALWGRYTENDTLMTLAKERLLSFKRLLTRRGFGSEYTATGYLTMQLHPIAMIVEYGADEEIRSLARDIETRLWIDLLGHFHIPSQTLSGPYSRSHNPLFGTSFSHILAALVLGDQVAGTWHESMEMKEKFANMQRIVNKYCVPYHCPVWLAEWSLSRQYPYLITGTADGCPSYATADNNKVIYAHRVLGDLGQDTDAYEYPAWHSRLVTYMQQGYSLGSSTRLFSSGEQSNIFVVSIATKNPLESLRNSVRLCSRYVVNEDVPYEPQLIPDENIVFHMMPKFPEMGRAIGLQHERTAMILYHPRLHVVNQATSLKTTIFISNKNFGLDGPNGDEIYIGEQIIENFRGESVEVKPVFIRFADVYAAFIPMITTPLELPRKVAVRVRPEGSNTLGISFYNYEGEPLDLDRRSTSLIGNGFVCEMGSKAEDGDFESFRKRFETVVIKDRHHADYHTRNAYRRQTLYSRPGLEMEMEYSPLSEGIRFQTVNGKVPAEPQLEADDLPLEKIPFL